MRSNVLKSFGSASIARSKASIASATAFSSSDRMLPAATQYGARLSASVSSASRPSSCTDCFHCLVSVSSSSSRIMIDRSSGHMSSAAMYAAIARCGSLRRS